MSGIKEASESGLLAEVLAKLSQLAKKTQLSSLALVSDLETGDVMAITISVPHLLGALTADLEDLFEIEVLTMPNEESTTSH